MRKLAAFIQVSLDGYFADSDGGIDWAYKDPTDAEWNAFVAGNAKGGGQLLFGRITYEFMASYWPTPMAAANNPVVAERMNSLPKLVFSRTLDAAPWQNTTLVTGDLVSWNNMTQQGHWPVPDDRNAYGLFSATPVDPDQSSTAYNVIAPAGTTISYHCYCHPEERGKIVVVNFEPS